MRVDGVPIVGHIAPAIALHMRIFALDQRLGEARVAGIGDGLIDAEIHRREDIGIGIGLRLGQRAPSQIVDQPRWVASPCLGCRHFERRADPCFIAQGPEDDRRMVLVALDHVDDARDMGRVPGRIIAKLVQFAFGVALPSHFHIGMGFDIGLVHDIEAIFIGQIIPARVVGVMRRAYRVDIVALHHFDVAPHRRHRNDVERVRVMLMPVDAADHDRAAINHQLPVTDRDIAKADALGGRLHDRTLVIQQLQQQRVEVGRFCRPSAHARQCVTDPHHLFGLA